MCGIFGAALADPGEPVDVEAALRAIGHRGPDVTGCFRGPGIVLGHTRLAVLDLSPAANQPMGDPGGMVQLVFNGEIYNHHELRAELVARGHRFRTRSDTEVIVEGYRAWGDEVVERLDGMFALGLWDAERRRLLLARDRTGKKPLFYAAGPGGLRFASEIKALVASGLPAEPDLDALPALLSFGYVAAPRTLYRGVAQLPPASLLVREEGGKHRVSRYWRAPFTAPPLDLDLATAEARLRELLEAAVRRRLEADVPLGAFLSGGLDSTIVVGLAARLTGRPVKTFSIGFAGDRRYDETAYARLAARAFATDHVEFTLEPSSFELVEALVAQHDGPFGDSSAIPTTVVSRLTRQHVTVALTGDGGDELFCGYDRFLAAEAAERTPLPVRRVLRSLAHLLPRGDSERAPLTRARRFLDACVLPLPDRLARWTSLFAFDLDRLLRPELAARLPLAEPLGWTRQVLARSAGASTLRRVLDHNFETYLPGDLLVKADRCSMAHALELRAPFLDTALIEFAARLPDRFVRRGLTTKWILRRAFADLLPPAIRRRGKMGFGMPLGAWFRGPLRPVLEDHLGPRARLHDLLRPEPVAELLRAHLEGRADHGHRLWLLLTLEVWLRSLAAPPTLPPAP